VELRLRLNGSSLRLFSLRRFSLSSTTTTTTAGEPASRAAPRRGGGGPRGAGGPGRARSAEKAFVEYIL